MTRNNNEGSRVEVKENIDEASSYDEIYLAFGRLRKLMRFFGLFPINETEPMDSLKSVINGLRFRWNSVWVLANLITFTCITISFYFFIWEYSLLIPNPMEGVVISLFAIVLCWCANVNLVSSLIQGKHLPSYFKNWQVIDQALDIQLDVELRTYVRHVSIGVTILSTFSILSTILTIVVKYVVGDFSGDGFVFAITCYCFCINACYLLPEIFFAYLCKALVIRFQELSKKIQRVISLTEASAFAAEVTDDISKLRIIYQLLMDIIGQTNHIMGPILIITCGMNTFTLSGGIYFLVRHSLANFGFFMMKIMLLIMSSSRLTFVCLHANSIKVEVKRMLRVLYQAPTVKMTPESVNELHLFLKCTKPSNSNFTACDFVILDKEFLNTVASIIVTYTISLLQFDRDLESDSSVESECSHS